MYCNSHLSTTPHHLEKDIEARPICVAIQHTDHFTTGGDKPGGETKGGQLPLLSPPLATLLTPPHSEKDILRKCMKSKPRAASHLDSIAIQSSILTANHAAVADIGALFLFILNSIEPYFFLENHFEIFSTA